MSDGVHLTYTQPPLTDEQLAAIRDRHENHTVPRMMMRSWAEFGPLWAKSETDPFGHYRDYVEWAWLSAEMDRRDLLAELDRLRGLGDSHV